MDINLSETEIEFLGSDDFKLTTDELKAIMFKKEIRNQLLLAVMLQYYKIKRNFPATHNALVSYLSKSMADEIKTEPCYFHEIDVNHRTTIRFSQTIRGMFGFREATDADGIHFINWLVSDLLPKMPQDHEIKVALKAYYQLAKIEPFSDNQEERYLGSAKNKFETQIFEKISHHLSPTDKKFIDTLLNHAADDNVNKKQRSKEINLNTLKKGIPGAKLKHVPFALEKYEAIETLWLPESITAGLSRKILLKYYDRIMAYSPSHINELDERAKYAMIAIFCHVRAELLADSLGNLFSKLVIKIKKSSENYVKKTAVKEIKRVEGKFDILLKLTETALDYPDGMIKDAIYPVVDIETLKRIKADLSQRGNWYKKQVRTKMRSLYSRGSRTELLDLLSVLKFNTRDDEDKALLLPRLKNIHKQKLYMVSDSDKQLYTNLTDILKDSIQWKHIETDYNEVVKHIVALKLGLVEADVFVKRFSKDNYKHPAYKALCEIGKAAKTIFLCKYLQQEELRIEINAGLNIVERLNGVMNFFLYGKLGEINSNDPDEQELSILCLHLLQACAVYINTLLIQEILSDPYWRSKLTPEDYRALSPLIHSHFNPYGTFLLDLAKRLMINIEDFAHAREQSNASQRESEAVNQTA